MTAEFRVRPIRAGDWPAIVALEASVYGPAGLSESPDALESRGSASPGTSFVLDAGAGPAGYLLALPYPENRFPDLTRPESRIYRSANLHLHDLVVREDLRGRGLARLLLRHLTEAARAAGHTRVSMVAVGGAAGFWRSQGFAEQPRPAPPPGYGADAVHMSTLL